MALLTRGFGDYLIELANALSECADVHVIVAKADEWMAGYLPPAVTVFRSGASRVRHVSNVSAITRVGRYLRQISPDIVHLQQGVTWELLVKLFVPATPLVVTIHDVTKHASWHQGTVRYRVQQLLLDCGARMGDALIVHGEQLRRQAELRYVSRLNSRRIYNVPHGILTRYGGGIGKYAPTTEGNVLFFGSISKYKGIEYLVSAEPLIRTQLPNVTIKIAGMAANPQYYATLPKAGQRIEMILEYQNEREVRQLFEWADVIVLPYIEASQSGVLQIAMAFAVPVVVTSVGSLSDVVQDEVNGLVVPPGDANALGRAIVRLLKDVPLRARIISKMHIARNGTVNWKTIAAQTMVVYEEMIAETTSLRVSGS